MTCTRFVRHGRGPALAIAAWLAAAPITAVTATAEGTGETARTPAHEGLGIIRGVLFKEDEITRLSGATVTAINVRTARRYVSNFTGDNGAYEVGGLPAGTYDLAIDTAARVYVTDALIDLAENQRLYLSFAVRAPTGAAADTPLFKGGAKMTFTDPNAVPQASGAAARKGFWKRPGGIAIISILVAGTAAAAVSAQQSD
jgi:hypothetical protein